jgi:hypothetical protein
VADTPTFDTVEEAQAYYGRLLKDTPADDPKRLSLELEQARSESSILRREQADLRRKAWVQQALSEFPNATADDLRGDNEEAIKASAKTIHDRIEEAKQAALEARSKELEEQAGRRAYGKVGVAGGGAPVLDADSDDAVIERSQRAFLDRGRSGVKPESPDKALHAHVGKILGV